MSPCSRAPAGPPQSESALPATRGPTYTAASPGGWHRSFRRRAWSTWYATPSPACSRCTCIVSPGRERRRAEVALLDDRYLGPSRYGFQLAAFLDHFDRSQVLVVASEVLRDRPREALSTVFDHLGVNPAAADSAEQHRDHRSADKPVPRLHDLGWLPRRQVKLRPRWRPDQRGGLARFLTTRPARPGDSAIHPDSATNSPSALAPTCAASSISSATRCPVTGDGQLQQPLSLSFNLCVRVVP